MADDDPAGSERMLAQESNEAPGRYLSRGPSVDAVAPRVEPRNGRAANGERKGRVGRALRVDSVRSAPANKKWL